MTWAEWEEIKDVLDDMGIRYEVSLATVIKGVAHYSVKLPKIEYNLTED